MENWRERVKRTMRDKKITQETIAEKLGVSQGTINHWLSGRRTPGVHQVSRLAEILNVSPAWLHYGEDSNVEPGPIIRTEVPLISWVQAGQWCNISNPYPVGVGEKMIATTANVGPQGFALRVRGDSMTNPNGSPSFPEGSLIIVDPSRIAENGSYVIARLDDSDEATFKQLVIDGGHRYLKPLNPRYPILEINGNCTICGVVRQLVWDFY